MRDNQLSKGQIKYLFDFVKKKYVKYIDVQYELVDHLATAIEEEMISDENLTFDEALKEVYGRFPVTGFYHWVEQKEKGLMTYWRKRQLSYLKQYMKLPKLIISLTISFLLYFILLMNNDLLLMNIVVFYFISIIYITIKNWKTLNFWGGIFEFGSSTKVLTIKAFYRSVIGSFFTFNYLFFYIISFHNWKIVTNTSYNPFSALFVALIATILIMYMYTSLHVFPKLLKEEIQKKYAHLGLNTYN